MDDHLSTTVGDTALMAARRPIEQARHLPGYVYHSPEVLALEKERLFLKEWLCVGRVEELGEPGAFQTLRLLGEPVVVVRDLAGELRAFSNICAHRGVEVAVGSGNAKEFSCPYHGWTYGLDGHLIGAPYMREAENFDVQSCRLQPVRLGTWAGWIFVNFYSGAPSLDDWLAGFASEFAFLHQEECSLANKSVYTLDCNWKLVAENLVDIYHVHVLHSSSFGRGRKPIDYLRDRPNLTGYYEAPPMAPGGKSPFGKMPWLADKPYNYACMGHLDPNLQLFGRSDAVHVIVIWPLTAAKSQIVFYDLLPTAHFGAENFEERANVYRDYWRLVLEEDRSMIESLQRAMSSSRFKPGPLSSLEHGVHRMLQNYVKRVFAD